MCPKCGEKLYSCKNCKWHGIETITSYDGDKDVYDWCYKFDQSTYKVEKALGKVKCPVWELPEDVNYCKTCGRYLREN